LTLHLNFGDGAKALSYARDLAGVTADAGVRSIANVTKTLLTARSEGELETVKRQLRAMADAQRASSTHHFGVTMLNLALISLAQDRVVDGIAEVEVALDAFESTAGSLEQSACRVVQLQLFLRKGSADEAKAIATALGSRNGFVPNEAYVDAADAFDSFGSSVAARALLDRVGDRSTQTLADRRTLALCRARMSLRRGNLEEADRWLGEYPSGLSTVIGEREGLAVTRAHIALRRSDPTALDQARDAVAIAGTSGASASRRLGELLIGLFSDPQELSQRAAVVAAVAPWHLTFLAEELIPRLGDLTPDALGAVHLAAELHPERWREALRLKIDADGREVTLEAARLLERIGEVADIARLRRLARTSKPRYEAVDLGRSLTRRLANRVRVEDQGRISIEIGNRVIAGSSIRRKVLAMVSYLLTRPELSATRDQVLDALWPEQSPEAAVNSLNQTVYFMRRVFEEPYSDDLSPGYVHHDSDVVWLDADLVTSRSLESRRLIREIATQATPEEVDRLTRLYKGRFALDFEYEEWAAEYRDPLHASYLEIVERSVLDDLRSGHYDRGITVARRALEADPSAEQIELSLLRLYRVTGAHAAAAEQYAHYATVLRDELGVEPPPLESL
jgi:DNA-binding SARP family transcriptional activator